MNFDFPFSLPFVANLINSSDITFLRKAVFCELKMKLGVAYNVFDGHELLKASILSIRRAATYVCIVFQTLSNFYEPAHPKLLSLLQEMVDEGLVNELIYHKTRDYTILEREAFISKSANPLDVGDSVLEIGAQFFNEIAKRSAGREACLRNGCTHFLLMDTDEFYEHDRMIAVMEDIDTYDYDSTACKMRLYFKEPIYEMLPVDDLNWVPFICKIESDKPLRLAAPASVIVDPTRRIENSTRFRAYERHEIEMHHMTFVRKDILSKMKNVSNKGNLMDIDLFVQAYEEWTPDKGILHPHLYWTTYFTTVAFVPNLFGVDFSKQCDFCFRESKLRCSSCKQSRYCTPECQKLFWPSHKKKCRQAKTRNDTMGSSVMLWHCIKIVSASLFGALLSEAISYVLIYRTESYQRLKENISKTQKKLDTMKEGSGSMAERKRQKKIDRFEEDLKFTTQELSLVKMKSMLAVAFTMITLFSMLNSHFDGVVVAKLPFTPIEFFQRISHRNLPGSDFTDCSMSFLYVMCSMFIRSNVQKFFGNAPPKTPSIFEMAKQE